MTRSPGQNGATAKSFPVGSFCCVCPMAPPSSSCTHRSLLVSSRVSGCPSVSVRGSPSCLCKRRPMLVSVLSCVCALVSSSSEPVQSGSSFPCSSLLLLSKPGVGRLLSAAQDPRVGVPDVELDSLAPQTKALLLQFISPSIPPSRPETPRGGDGATSLPLSLPLVVEAVVQDPGPLQRDSLHVLVGSLCRWDEGSPGSSCYAVLNSLSFIIVMMIYYYYFASAGLDF